MNLVNENKTEVIDRSEEKQRTKEKILTETVLTEKVPAGEALKESVYTREMKNKYPYFAGLSFLYGVIYTVCMYRNPAGITFPVLVLITLAFALVCLKLVHVEGKVRTHTMLYFTAMLLLGISTCLTANGFFHFFNKAAIVMLFCAAMLHQLYDDEKWQFPVFLKNLFVLWGDCIVSVGSVFTHAVGYRAKEDSNRKRNVLAVMKGIGLAILILIFVLPLLISSDLIIANFLNRFWEGLYFGNGVGITVNLIAGVVLFYAFFAALFKKNIRDTEGKESKKAESLTGITFISILTVIYVCYAGVQIVFLFLRAGVLPEDLTYSQYAHEGFWQLLAVSIINIVMILVCMQRFRKHKVLNILLLVTSLCTYVMTASAAYRMILYVGAYHLTFLRILVLWFLGVLSLVMIGMMIAIFNEKFPLFQYSAAVVTCCYIAFSFMRVDEVIASYNIEHMKTMSMNDVWYMTEALSADAAEYIVQIEPDMVCDLDEYGTYNGDGVNKNILEETKQQYFEMILQEEMSFRKWNYGKMKAREIAENYLASAD